MPEKSKRELTEDGLVYDTSNALRELIKRDGIARLFVHGCETQAKIFVERVRIALDIPQQQFLIYFPPPKGIPDIDAEIDYEGRRLVAVVSSLHMLNRPDFYKVDLEGSLRLMGDVYKFGHIPDKSFKR